MIRVYIAAPYQTLDTTKALAETLQAAGIEVTSRWLFEDSAEMTDEWARKDLDDVRRADMLLALNLPGWENSGTGGRHVEFGYALALHKPVLLIGKRTHIFHYLNEVAQLDVEVDSVAELIKRSYSAGLSLAGIRQT